MNNAANYKNLFVMIRGGGRRLLIERMEVADNICARMKGLLKRERIDETEGMLITPCNCVHTFGMKFPIDIVFIDKHGCVISSRMNVDRNRVAGVFKAKHTLELPAGMLETLAIRVGDQLAW